MSDPPSQRARESLVQQASQGAVALGTGRHVRLSVGDPRVPAARELSVEQKAHGVREPSAQCGACGLRMGTPRAPSPVEFTIPVVAQSHEQLAAVDGRGYQ